MYSNPDILFYQAVQKSMPSKNDHGNFKIYTNYSNFINFTGMIWTSQGLLDGDTVSSNVQVFALKIYASFAADAFCRLHNDKYIKFQPIGNCGFRANYNI
jgi:hypothetical protein